MWPRCAAPPTISPGLWARRSPARSRSGVLSASIMSDLVDNPVIPMELKAQVVPDAITFVGNELYAEAAKCEPDDTLLVYFAGHGMIHGGGLTLLLDSTVVDHFLLSTALPAQDVMRALQDSRAKHKILILDCCNAGTLAKEMGLRSDRVPMEELGVKSENIDILLASDHL